MLRNLFRVATVGAAVVAAVGLSMPAAEAATGYARCTAGNFCVFSEPNGGGTIALFKLGSPDLRGQHIDDTVSSAWNRGADAFALCRDYNRVWNLTTYFPGAQANIEPENDNQASSVAKGAWACDG
jgi:hypothetical protein